MCMVRNSSATTATFPSRTYFLDMPRIFREESFIVQISLNSDPYLQINLIESFTRFHLSFSLILILFSVKTCVDKWEYLCSMYSRKRNALAEAGRSGSGASQLKKWIFYHQMGFFDNFVLKKNLKRSCASF